MEVQVQMIGSRSLSVQRITVQQIEENFGPYITQKTFKVKCSDIVSGVHVRLRNGKTGTIRYIDDDDTFIGIEFDSVYPEGHCGKGHFKTPIGRGYIAKRSHVVHVRRVTSNMLQQQQRLYRLNKKKIADITMFDTVILESGERGRVVFIGDVHFDDNQMLGIELEKWSRNGHNGSIDGKTYFVVREGHGLLVPKEAAYDVISKEATTPRRQIRAM